MKLSYDEPPSNFAYKFSFRHYNVPESGSITLDGFGLGDLNARWLKRRVSLVAQVGPHFEHKYATCFDDEARTGTL